MGCGRRYKKISVVGEIYTLRQGSATFP